MTSIRDRQELLNAWTGQERCSWLTALVEDGIDGPRTERRISEVKWWAGLPDHRNSDWTADFEQIVRHPGKPVRGVIGRDGLRRGRGRRRSTRARWYLNNVRAFVTPGVTRWGGHWVAKPAVPHLDYARDHGWDGPVYSGWRSPAYSEHLCEVMCGAPSCPGRCAGRDSMHSGTTADRYAVDVGDYDTFDRLMADEPLPAGAGRLLNDLPNDRPHHSPTGH